MNAATKVGFVGLGVMGFPMVANLRKAGHDVSVYDVVEAVRDRSRNDGIDVAADLSSLIATSDIVITMLPDTPDVDAVLHAAGGLLERGRAGQVYIDMSTISPIATREFASELAEKGISMIDAPVSGGVQKAITGELSIMVGGEEETLNAVLPILTSMGNPTHIGDAGAGQATKACNQVCVAIGIQAIAEAFALGSKLGLDLDRLYAALLSGSCNSFLLENHGPLMLAGDDDPGFRVALQVKDLKIAKNAALDTSTALPGASTVLDLYLDAIANGQATDGNQSLSRVYERITGATIGKQPHHSAPAIS